MKKETRGGRKKRESFEEALKRLEEIVQSMETGDLTLEVSLGLFEEGVRLTRVCSQRLDEAEKKIELLTRDEQGGVKTKAVDPNDFQQKISNAEGEGEVGCQKGSGRLLPLAGITGRRHGSLDHLSSPASHGSERSNARSTGLRNR